MTAPVSTWAAALDADLAMLALPACERTWYACDLREDVYRQHRCGLAGGHDGPHQCRYADRSEYRGGRWTR